MDFPAIYELIRESFRDDPHSDHTEQDLVRRLKDSSAFIPELCLCAYLDGSPVGFILVSRVVIAHTAGETPFLSLAPVCVLPEYQKSGIGSQLINHVHKTAMELGEPGIVLIGHDTYYPRFGYQQAAGFGIQFPFEVPPQYCMIKVFSGKPKGGMVTYPGEFYGE